MCICQDGSLKHLKTGIVKESGSRTDADRHDHKVRGKGSVIGHYTFGALVAFDSLEGGRGMHAHTGCLELPFCIVSHLCIKCIGHDLGSGVDDRYFHATRHQVLCHFKTDESGAADHRPTALLFLGVGACIHGVVRGAYAEDSRKRGPVYRRYKMHRLR